MKRKITVAAVQMAFSAKSITSNLITMENMLKKIFAKQHCDLVVFPEYCITSSDIVLDQTSEPIKRIQELAKQYKTYIVCGSFLKKIKGKLFNTSLLINTKGEIILEYHKNNLWLTERDKVSYGKSISSIDTEIGKIGIIICWDLMFPETLRKLIRQDVDIICCPSYWMIDLTGTVKRYVSGGEKMMVNTLCSARAIENEVLLVFANGAGEARFTKNGKQSIDELAGQTQICAPLVGAVARIDNNKEGFITYTYDRKMAVESEQLLQIKNDLHTRIL